MPGQAPLLSGDHRKSIGDVWMTAQDNEIQLTRAVYDEMQQELEHSALSAAVRLRN
jgi:hypothetical protein